MKKTALAVVTMLATILMLAVPATYAQGQSQITINCTTAAPHAGSHPAHPCVSSELATTPPIIGGGTLYFIGGFWIWCQSPTGGTPYGPDCKGSVYIEEIDLSTGAGHYEATSISGGATGPSPLTVTFSSSDGDMTCALTISGSTMTGFCDGTPITFTNVGINIT